MKIFHSLTQNTGLDGSHPDNRLASFVVAALLIVSNCPAPAQTAPAAAAPAQPPQPISGTPPIAPVPPVAGNVDQPPAPGPGPAGPLTPVAPGPARPSLPAPTLPPPLLSPTADRAPRVGELLIAEESGNDPAAAAEQYRAAVARFDAQRADAAQAIFRLGESLRKLGRFEEAKVQYARILREFVDESDLVKLSQKRLTETATTARVANLPSSSNERVEDLIAKEMAIVREQIATTQAQIANGVQSTAAVLPLRRELLRLEQERANHAEQRAANNFPAPIDSQAPFINSHQEDLRAIDGELRKQRLELQKLRSIASFIEKGPVETLTTRVIDDPRFRELKDDYDKTRTNAEADKLGEAGKEGVKRALDRLQTWVNQVYLPELRSSIEFVEAQLVPLLIDRDALEKQVRDKANEERAAASSEAAQTSAIPSRTTKPARR